MMNKWKIISMIKSEAHFFFVFTLFIPLDIIKGQNIAATASTQTQTGSHVHAQKQFMLVLLQEINLMKDSERFWPSPLVKGKMIRQTTGE